MTPVHIVGHAIWAPGHASADAYFAGVRDSDVVEPPIAFVHSRMQRAISLMCRMAVQVVHDATAHAELDISEVATVFGSSHGEMQIAIDQMVMMQDGEGRLSPARFKNSVHNTAAGLFSIAAKNRGFTTAIAAGDHTFSLALLEGACLVASGEAQHAVVCTSDEALPEPLDRCAKVEALAAAVVLSAESHGPRLGIPHIAPDEDASEHPAMGAVHLIKAARESSSGLVRLSHGAGGYVVEMDGP